MTLLLIAAGVVVALVAGAVFGYLLRSFCDRFPAYPPATRQQIDRAARANRADLSAMQDAQRGPLPVLPLPVLHGPTPPLDNFDHLGGTKP